MKHATRTSDNQSVPIFQQKCIKKGTDRIIFIREGLYDKLRGDVEFERIFRASDEHDAAQGLVWTLL